MKNIWDFDKKLPLGELLGEVFNDIQTTLCPAFSFWRAQKSRIWAMGTHGHINALVLCKIDFTTVACGIQAFSSSRPKCNPALYQGKNKGEMSLHIDFIFIEHWMDPYVHHFSNIKNSWTCLMFILKRSNLDQIFRFSDSHVGWI